MFACLAPVVDLKYDIFDLLMRVGIKKLIGEQAFVNVHKPNLDY